MKLRTRQDQVTAVIGLRPVRSGKAQVFGGTPIRAIEVAAQVLIF